MVRHLHKLNIRSNHLVLTVHELLIKVLEFSLTLHDACKTKNNLNIGLAEVITAHHVKFKAKKSLQVENYKYHFYDSAGNLKTSINIRKLDITVLAILLRTNFITSPTKSANSLNQTCRCCLNCNHDQCFCGVKKPCINKGNCGYKVCSSCPLSTTWKCSIECRHKECAQGINPAISDCNDPRNCKKMGCPCPSSPKCEFMFVKRFVDVAAFFRNCFFHATFADYFSLAEGKPLENFPLSTSWEDIWKIVNKASLDCLFVLCKNKYIDKEVYKDYEMKLRISLKEDENHLIEVVSKDFQRLSDAVMGEEGRLSDNLKTFRKEINKGIF